MIIKLSVELKLVQKHPYNNQTNCRVVTKCCGVVKQTTENIQYYNLDKYQKRAFKGEKKKRQSVIGGRFSNVYYIL